MNLDITIDEVSSQLLDYFIGIDSKDPAKLIMQESDKYYGTLNTNIMARRKMMMLYTEDEVPYLKDDFSKANHKARHSYLQELVNQCTNYLAGKPMKIQYKEKVTDETKEKIDDELYRNNNFLGFLQKNIDALQLYGVSYFRIIKTEDGFNKFVVYDPKEIIMFYNDFDEPILCIRYFSKPELDEKTKEVKQVKYAEVFDFKFKDTYVNKPSRLGNWTSLGRELVYASKVSYQDEDGNEIKSEVTSLDVPVFPVIEWKFNDKKIPTLVNIKDFIDFQDLNLSDLANNVEDIQEAIWILENYNGQNLKEFMEDLKVRKAIKVGTGGNAHSETVQIPTEARSKLYELCDKNIYKFGFGINFSERDSLGNVTGVALKWSYAPLEQKANAIENNGQEALNNFFNILFHILGIDYDSNDMEFIFDRSMIANEQEQTNTVMSASSVLSQETILSNLPMVKDVDEEIKALEGEEDVYNNPAIPTQTTGDGEENEEETDNEDEDTSNTSTNRSNNN